MQVHWPWPYLGGQAANSQSAWGYDQWAATDASTRHTGRQMPIKSALARF